MTLPTIAVNWRPHAKYLRYVLLHKFYVARAGLAIDKVMGGVPEPRARWWWRLLVHDLSKFSPAEWSPYVQMFYGEQPRDKREQQARFNAAWLHHIHRNPHHWQHHILHEDSGKTIILVPHAALAYEMVADWLAAGPKALTAHTMAEAVAETIVWYAKVHHAQQMRTIVRESVEFILHSLATYYGISAAAQAVESAQRTRASIVIPGRA